MKETSIIQLNKKHFKGIEEDCVRRIHAIYEMNPNSKKDWKRKDKLYWAFDPLLLLDWIQ